MFRISLCLLGPVVLIAALAGAAAADQPATTGSKEAAEPYEGFTADRALLRKHLIHKGRDGAKHTKASSGEACLAAQRIFSRVSLLFRTREEVLELLGDPATISDYNQPAGKDPSSPLVYVFDTGLGGLMYTVRFRAFDQVRVAGVQVESQD